MEYQGRFWGPAPQRGAFSCKNGAAAATHPLLYGAWRVSPPSLSGGRCYFTLHTHTCVVQYPAYLYCNPTAYDDCILLERYRQRQLSSIMTTSSLHYSSSSSSPPQNGDHEHRPLNTAAVLGSSRRSHRHNRHRRHRCHYRVVGGHHRKSFCEVGKTSPSSSS